jgi:hypothetical protein
MSKKDENLRIHYKRGDLVKSKIALVYGCSEQFGIIVDIDDNAPKHYPIYQRKYKITWINGHTAWYWSNFFQLVVSSQEK